MSRTLIRGVATTRCTSLLLRIGQYRDHDCGPNTVFHCLDVVFFPLQSSNTFNAKVDKQI
jgi:hypothetical protein